MSNISKVPPDKTHSDSHKLSNTNNLSSSNAGKDLSSHLTDNLDEYKELDSEDEYDADTQSLGESKEPGEDTGTSYQIQIGPLSHTSNVDDSREVTGKQGLSPRGRKLLKNNKNTSFNKPNTRDRSRGV